MGESSELDNWDARADGMSQLRELNAMERSQDSTYWISSAILIAANAVLVAEFFRQEDHYLARLAISIVGLMIAAVMVLLVARAMKYKRRWLDKAKALETELGVPSKYAVWEEKGLPGFAASLALMLAMYGFVVMWASCAAFAAWNLVL
jgi:membrane-associated HD superfamily phosphohydrolase